MQAEDLGCRWHRKYTLLDFLAGEIGVFGIAPHKAAASRVAQQTADGPQAQRSIGVASD